MLKLIFLPFLLIVNSAPQNFETLLCKEWKIRYMDESGRRKFPDGGEVNDRFIFNANHTVEIREAGESEDGLWQYDAATKRLVLNNRITKEKITITIITLTKEELVLKIMDDPEGNATVYLVPVK